MFDLDASLLKDLDALIEEFVADWVATFTGDDEYALSPPFSNLVVGIPSARISSFQKSLAEP